MTPQTAAALRALSDKLKRTKVNSGGFVEMPHDFGLYDLQAIRAAVLTQEGADDVFRCTQEMERFIANPRAASDEPLFTASMYGTADAALKARDEWRAAQREPRAAEGAGTVEWRDKPGDVFRSFKAICKLPEGDARSEAFLWFSHGYACMNPLPAAAAVPAGGDAVAWVMFEKGNNLPVSGSQPYAVEPSPYIQEFAGKFGREWRPVFSAPAPRGGVTEAMVLRFLSWKLPDSVSPGGLWPAGEFRKKYGHPLTGTNLLNDPEARAMLAHVLATAPSAATATEPYVIECDECGCRGRFCKCTPAELDAADRKAKHAQFTDPDFNRWLDDGISDCGHTVRDTITNIHDAWAAWNARPHYTAEHSSATGERTQDAWPMARHWREAMKLYFAPKVDEEDCDEVEWKARDLAAKEAK